MKPGSIETVSINLDLITAPIPIPHASAAWTGTRLIPSGGVEPPMPGFKVKKWGGKGDGNKNNARWRRPHGGAFCSPVNEKIRPSK